MVLMEALVIYVELEFVFHRLVAVEEDNREDLEGDLVFTVEQQDQETQEVIAHQKEMTVDQEALVMVSQEAGAAQVALDNLVTEITKAEQV